MSEWPNTIYSTRLSLNHSAHSWERVTETVPAAAEAADADPTHHREDPRKDPGEVKAIMTPGEDAMQLFVTVDLFAITYAINFGVHSSYIVYRETKTTARTTMTTTTSTPPPPPTTTTTTTTTKS